MQLFSKTGFHLMLESQIAMIVCITFSLPLGLPLQALVLHLHTSILAANSSFDIFTCPLPQLSS